MILKWVNDMKNYNFVKREISLNLIDEDWGRIEEKSFVSDLINCAFHWFDRRHYD